MKTAIFELWGDYAHFRKYYTNMSPLTYTFPPRTVLAGILGAMIGIDKEKNPEIFSENKSFFALKVVNEPGKIKIPTNYIKTQSSLKQVSRFKEHKPTLVEYLKNPRYRVYFHHYDDSLFNKVVDCLRNHRAHYTICLGISGCLADFEYLDAVELKQEDGFDEWIDIQSIVLQNNIIEVDWEKAGKVLKTQMPRLMRDDREIVSYQEYIYDIRGSSIKMKVKKRYFDENRGEVICEM